jgi:hypothetical protein
MAKIIFSLEELVDVLIACEILPLNIVRARAKDDEIHFVIKTQSPILPYIPASLRYLRFENNHAIFELTLVGGRADKVMSMIDPAIGIKMPEYIKFEYPLLIVDVDKLFDEKNIKSMRAEEVFFEDGQLNIVVSIK